MTELFKERNQGQAYKMFDRVAKTYDLLNQLLSFGIDKLWRRRMIRELPSQDKLHILDLATGTGDVALALSKLEKVQKVEGLDLSGEMLKFAQVKADGLPSGKKVHFSQADGMNLPKEDETFDVATISFGIRNFQDPQQGLREMARVVRPGGQVMVLEFSLPKNFFVRGFYLVYFRFVLPFIGRIVSGDRDAYLYLNKTVESFPYGEGFLSLMKTAGLKQTRMIPLSFGISTLYIGKK